MAEQPRAWVVIVNYRCAELTQACIRSLEGERPGNPGLRVVVVDNASGRGELDELRGLLSGPLAEGWVELLPSAANSGFAAGNNLALRQALGAPDPPEYVLLLNPDTLVHAGAIQALVSFLEGNPRVGIAGSRLEDPDGTPQRSAFRFPSLWSELDDAVRLGVLSRLLSRRVVAPPVVATATAMDWVSGASMMMRRQVLEQVGLMDDGYFMYFEETDYCLAASRAGWTCHYVPASRVIHLVGGASGGSEARAAQRRPSYWFDSRRRYFRKNHGRAYTVLADLIFLVGYGSWRVRRRLQRKPDTDPPHFFGDFLRHSSLGRRA